MGFTCLEDWIGVRGCNGNVSDSGVYLNDLPGIELRNIDEVANEEQVNFSGVWSEVQARALNRFSTDVIAGFSKKYRLKMLTKGIQIGKDYDNTTPTAAGAQYRGFIIELNTEDAQLVYSNLQVIYIQKLQLWLPGALNTTFKIFDLDLGTELFTSSVTGSAGWNEVNVNEIFTAQRIFCCYDATTIASAEIDLNLFNTCCSVPNYNYFWNYGGRLRGAYSAIATPTTITIGENSFGFSGVFSIQCKYDNLVCNNRELFTQPLLYCLGVEFMTEVIYSPRMNRWTTTDLKKAKMLRQEYEAKYKGGKITDGEVEMNFAGELQVVLDSVQLNLTDGCLECNQQIMYKDAYI